MEFLKGNNATLISTMDLPLNIVYTLKYGESPNTYIDAPTINTILQSFYSLDFKNRFVSANMESSKIIANLPLKLIC